MIKPKTIIWILAAAIVILFILAIVLAVALSKKKKNDKSDENIPADQKLNWANSAIYLAGFKYDPSKKIFTSRRDALQRLGGYNKFYDDQSVNLFMIIDIEPIIFVHNKTEYMIELWKGQYCAATGCEIGIYIASKSNNGKDGEGGYGKARYYCAPDDQMVQMSYTLQEVNSKKNLFSQSALHWWLTGFMPGVFNDPSNLAMENIKMTFKESSMAKAFYDALVIAFKQNQKEYQYKLDGSTVSFRWQKPAYSPQPDADKQNSQIYNKNIVDNLNIIMNNDYSPEAINNKILEIIKFLETDDNIDIFADWAVNVKGGLTPAQQYPDPDNLMGIVSKYDSNNGNNNIANFINLVVYIKTYRYADLAWFGFLAKVYCNLVPNAKSGIFCKIFG